MNKTQAAFLAAVGDAGPHQPNRSERRQGIALDARIAVSPREAAQLLGVSVPTIYSLLNSGELASRKVGARRLIAVDELRHFAAR